MCKILTLSKIFTMARIVFVLSILLGYHNDVLAQNAQSKEVTAMEEIKNEIKKFKAITWISAGHEIPTNKEEPEFLEMGWIKFGIHKSELGWRTLEFLAWVSDDMTRSGERLRFFPTSPPPYLNEPGNSLAFVIEVYPQNGDSEKRFSKIADHINYCHEEYWPTSEAK